MPLNILGESVRIVYLKDNRGVMRFVDEPMLDAGSNGIDVAGVKIEALDSGLAFDLDNERSRDACKSIPFSRVLVPRAIALGVNPDAMNLYEV